MTGQQDAEFDKFSGSYDQTVNASLAFTGLDVDYVTRVKADYLLDLVAAHHGDAKRASVLDIGCGVGKAHGLIADRVGLLCGVDVSGASVAEAKRRNPNIRYESYAGEVLPFADASFDVAFAQCVLHHVPPTQWARFTAQMKRVLKPGGMAVVFEHNPRNPLTRRVVSRCPLDENAVLLQIDDARALLLGAGFRDPVEGFILSIPPSSRFLRRLDLALGVMRPGAQYFVKATA